MGKEMQEEYLEFTPSRIGVHGAQAMWPHCQALSVPHGASAAQGILLIRPAQATHAGPELRDTAQWAAREKVQLQGQSLRGRSVLGLPP